MYLRKVHIENIRSIAKLDWEIPQGREAGWHVVIGDNGAGKTAFLRAIALALVGVKEAQALRHNWDDWLRLNEREGHVELDFFFPQRNMLSETACLRVELLRNEASGLVSLSDKNQVRDSFTFFGKLGAIAFSAAYGPFRRFSGGRESDRSIFDSTPMLAAHLTIFGEDFALTECLTWLLELKFKQLEEKPEGALLDHVIKFVNQKDFLPHQARLAMVSSDGVYFVDGDGHQLSVVALSDGYRSILSMTFELIRQMARVYSPKQIFSSDSLKIIAPGVVLIDEVDAHLHPTWQRRIGLWFREHFPNIQFIVTTHSPLVCQAAEHGTVWRLPKPGSGENAEMVKGIALNRLLYGDVLDAYGTELFGEDVERSDAGRLKMQELAELNVKEVNVGLSKAEQKKQQELRAILPATTYTPDSAAVNGKHKGKRK